MNNKIIVAQKNHFHEITKFLYSLNQEVIDSLEKKINFYIKRMGVFILQKPGKKGDKIMGIGLTQVLKWFQYHENIVWIEDIFLKGEDSEEEKKHGELLLDHIKKRYMSLHPGIKLFIGNIKGTKTKTSLLKGLKSLGVFMTS